MAKKDALKSSLIQKKPVIEEKQAQKVVEQIHQSAKAEQEEETVKTSMDFPKSLYKAMKIKLLEDSKTMRDYIIELIEKDIKG